MAKLFFYYSTMNAGKSTMVLRIDANGKPVRDGEQIQIGGNERYVTVCRKHFKEGLAERTAQDLPFEDL